MTLLMVPSLFAAQNVVLVTLDGLRWQEAFYGADAQLVSNEKFVKDAKTLKAHYWHDSYLERREKLMPFLWQTIAKEGVLIGDRKKGSLMSVANEWYFSYPGYNEILTGQADNQISSNAKINNKNVTYLEWLNNQPKYQQKLAAFGSWDVFPYIYNTQRSGLYVNSGRDSYLIQPQSERISIVNELQTLTPSPWQTVRPDSYTFEFARDYLINIKPKTMVISLGETDDFAHDGHYDRYLYAATRTDAYLKALWQTIQTTPGYRNNTVMIIVTDHGRGYLPENWQHHASVKAVQGYMKQLNQFKNGIEGAEEIWMAAIGPRIKSAGLLTTDKEFKQDQIAATVLSLLGEDYRNFNPEIGQPIKEIFKK